MHIAPERCGMQLCILPSAGSFDADERGYQLGKSPGPSASFRLRISAGYSP
jgi:hypothetical protein